ncbi:hypothetical protein BC941DRAFT_172413 [Chlamydoabsidia padenii]|nr:hypothetical protein BC941DRAFT_172413 [Chlamydoabsidia padenii]
MRNGYIYSYGGLSMTFPYNNFKNSYDSSDSLFKVPGLENYMYEFLAYNKSGNNTNYFNVGYTYPARREMHTMTVLPNSDTFIMYGGVNGYSVLNDYCYTFDSTRRQWNKVIFQSGGPGPRFGHSAVLYGNDSLFVMFGANANGNVMSDSYVLNTTTFAWTAIPSFNTTGTPSSTSTESSNPGISTGVIVGIVVGAIAVIAIIAIGGYFLYRRGVFNSSEPTTDFTAPVYGQDGFGDEFARPTDEKFMGGVQQQQQQQQQAIGHSVTALPLANLGTVKQQHAQESIKMKPTNYDRIPMKPMSEFSDTTGTYVDDPTKPYSERLSDETHSTSGLVKPTESYYSNIVVKPHGIE